ncbi:MAG: cupin domain-containing protein [Nitrospinota bacterium]|nr:MAG: cupin domain-containing protein [Nitrospinota bacterium]
MTPTITDLQTAETETFPWGAIRWLCHDRIDPAAEQTLGIAYINPGQSNPLHFHPNCEELLYVLSGECEHTVGEAVFPLKAGMMLRIPPGVKHKALATGKAPLTVVISFSSGDRQTVLCAE